MNEAEKRDLVIKIHSVFLPGRPISNYDVFSGRQDQMSDVLSGIFQPGRHVILFGERGVGKTSLARVLVDIQRRNKFHVLETDTINCDESDNFSSLWHKVFCALPYTNEDGMTVYLDSLLMDEISPDNVRFALSRLKGPSLIVLDEVDQLRDPEAKSLLAATIKNLSDHSVDTTLILVGVADTINDLIVVQKSAERALVQVHMPRMSQKEIEEIIETGYRSLEMGMEAGAKNMITRLSQGLPFYTHSLCLYAGLAAINNGRTVVGIGDVADATVRVVYKAENVRTAYHKAVRSPQQSNLYGEALLACALTETDPLGYFTPAAVVKWMTSLTDKTYDVPRFMRYLTEFCHPRRGGILLRVGEKRRSRYRFQDPMMQPFVIINAVGQGKLGLDALEPTRPQRSREDYDEEVGELPF